jgi:hypothetical protein
MSAMIRKENLILTRRTVNVQSDLRVLNAAISHGAIPMLKTVERKPGKIRRDYSGDHGKRECTTGSTVKEYLTVQTNNDQELNMTQHDFSNTKKPVISPKKILFIGTLGSGKTTLAELLSRDTGFPYASIDECRIRFGDGTMYGEERARDHFLEACSRPASGILEFSGVGPHAENVRNALIDSAMPVIIIWLVLPLDTCITRALQRQKNIPAPYPWGPIESSVPALHASIEFLWDTIWSREPGFHATRQEFQGTTSIADMHSVVRKICLGR